ncbi:hypothetical protein [Aeromonas salmonicida]
MGYGGSDIAAGQTAGYSSDGGIDGIIKEDKLGLDSTSATPTRPWSIQISRALPAPSSYIEPARGFLLRPPVLAVRPKSMWA